MTEMCSPNDDLTGLPGYCRKAEPGCGMADFK